MITEYRPPRPEEMRQVWLANRIGFGLSTAEAEIDRAMAPPARIQPEWFLCTFEDGEVASQMATIPLTIGWNGRAISCGGVSLVATLPSHRRRGHLRELMTRAFVTMREGGQPVAMLWASMAAIYQRFGYGIACTNHVYDFDPRHLRFVDNIPTPGRVRLVRDGHTNPAAREVYARFAAHRTLVLHRTPEIWEHSAMSHRPSEPPRLMAAYEEDGEMLGYAIYVVHVPERRAPGPIQQLRVREAVWLTPAAHRALFQYLAGYDLAGSVYIHRMPVDDPLFHQAQEPRLLNITVQDGTLVRIVDVAQALEGRGYETDGRLVFSLSDDLCPWNTGAWELTVEGGHARVKRTDATPALQLTPRALAILASGHQPASVLARASVIAPPDHATLRAADALFATACAPVCLDGF